MADATETIRDRIRRSLVKSAEPPQGTIQEERAGWEAAVATTPLPAGVVAERVEMNSVRGLRIRPAEGGSDRIVVHVHGGGFTAGSSVTHRQLGAQLALAAACTVVVVDYRLAPEHPFPAARDDVLAFIAGLRRGATFPLALCGDSAGAHIALGAALALRDQGAPPDRLVLLSPWLDLGLSGDSLVERAAVDPLVRREALVRCREHYLGGRDARKGEIDVLHADLHGLPPTLVHVGSDEVLLSDAVTLVAQARSAGVAARGVIWPGLWHVFHAWAPELPEAVDALRRIGEFLARDAGD